MGIRAWIRNFLKPMKNPFAETAKDASGEVKVGESAEAIASRRWKLFKTPRLRREGIWARIANMGRLPDAWLRPITNRRTPKPCSYSNAGAGRMRQKRRKAESKKAA